MEALEPEMHETMSLRYSSRVKNKRYIYRLDTTWWFGRYTGIWDFLYPWRQTRIGKEKLAVREVKVFRVTLVLYMFITQNKYITNSLLRGGGGASCFMYPIR